jgi:23S rRNA pseudouridine1911/1915/1917 synthase
MAHLRHPLLGDSLYGGRLRIPPGVSARWLETVQGFQRQALHAVRLALTHPASGERLQWQAELPADMVMLLEVLSEKLDN